MNQRIDTTQLTVKAQFWMQMVRNVSISPEVTSYVVYTVYCHSPLTDLFKN